ncbi:MAG: CoA transferase subunit A, partial [Nitrospinota bacterium]|nr:CoA transferase subunit A [Nitrospinota bacterium]
CVDAVVEAPFGSMPHECYGLYEPAFSHIDAYCKRIAADGARGAKAYLKTHCYHLNAWEEFLDKLGTKALLAASKAGREVDHA